MSDEESPPVEEGDAGAPAWVMTFADLMSLLMCFFVLLLSFSEMDVQKYKQLSGSMKQAFGVQREIKAHEIPKGTSVVAKEFSPSKPQPTILNEVRQKTADENLQNLDATSAETGKANEETEADAREIAEGLQAEIKEGIVEVETEEKKIIIRILERGSFSSGLADINPDFKPVMEKIKSALLNVKGRIKVSGHTDDIPIATTRFRSNWELSSGRAVSVLHELTADEQLNPRRFEVSGHAETQPRVANDSPENRAKNRRVEIVIIQGDDSYEDDGPERYDADKDAIQVIEIEGLTKPEDKPNTEAIEQKNNNELQKLINDVVNIPLDDEGSQDEELNPLDNFLLENEPKEELDPLDNLFLEEEADKQE